MPLNGNSAYAGDVPLDVRCLAELSPVAWANGGGLTTELASGKIDATADAASAAWDWRISVARIERSGPFSALPGIGRALIPLTADLSELRIDGNPHRVRRHAIVRFDGGSEVVCGPVPAPVHVLNVMVRSGVVDAAVTIHPAQPSKYAVTDGFAVALEDVSVDGDLLTPGDGFPYRRGDLLPAGAFALVVLVALSTRRWRSVVTNQRSLGRTTADS
jgi:environmental stress-induced protein Ves